MVTRQRQGGMRSLRRYAFSARLKALLSPWVGLPSSQGRALHGQVRNISPGGLCLVTSQPVKPSRLIRCEIKFPEVPVTIPTLAQVRWTRKNSGKRTYLAGLQFVL